MRSKRTGKFWIWCGVLILLCMAICWQAFRRQVMQQQLLRRNDKQLIVFSDQGNGHICVAKLVNTPDASYRLADIKELPAAQLVNRNPSFSPDGRKIVFTSNIPMSWKLHTPININIIDSNGENLHRLTPDTQNANMEPTFSSDGQRILFISTQDIQNELGTDLYIIDIDGTHMQRLTHIDDKHAEYCTPSFSPDGKFIVCTTKAKLDMFHHLCLMNADGSNQQIIQLFIHGDVMSPLFSPDGKRIYFSIIQPNFQTQQISSGFYVLNSDGSGLKQISESGGLNNALGPYGDCFLYQSQNGVHTMKLDGSAQSKDPIAGLPNNVVACFPAHEAAATARR